VRLLERTWFSLDLQISLWRSPPGALASIGEWELAGFAFEKGIGSIKLREAWAFLEPDGKPVWMGSGSAEAVHLDSNRRKPLLGLYWQQSGPWTGAGVSGCSCQTGPRQSGLQVAVGRVLVGTCRQPYAATNA
jgi:hypothetical protein